MQSWEKLIKEASKDVIIDFVRHVQSEVKKGNPFFLHSGVDESFDRYEALFQRSMSTAFGVYDRVSGEAFDPHLVESCARCIKESLAPSKYTSLREGSIVLEAVVDVGMTVLKKAREDHFRLSPKFIEECQP